MTVDQWEKYLTEHRGSIEAAHKLFRQNREAPEAECVIETSNLMVAFARCCIKLVDEVRRER